MQQRDERGVVGDRVGRVRGCRRGDERCLPEQEDVVGLAGGPAVGGIGVVVAVDDQHVGPVARCVRVEHVDHVVVAGGAARAAALAERGVEARLAAGGVDGVRVGARLAVERQRVAGRDAHRLQLVDEEEVLTVGAGRRVQARARKSGVGRARRGVGAVHERPAAEVRLVEVEGVAILVAEDARDVAVETRVDLAAAGEAERARGDHAGEMHDRAVARVARVGDQPAAGELVHTGVVAVDVDVVPGHDLGVGVGVHVVADA